MSLFVDRKYSNPTPKVPLRLKLVLVFATTYAVLMSIFIYLDLDGVHTLIEEEMKGSSTRFAKTLSVVATSAISAGQFDALQQYVLSAGELSYIRNIIIQDVNNLVIASTASSLIGTGLDDEAMQRISGINVELVEEIGTPPKDLLHQSGHAFRVIVPITVSGERVGLVHVETFSRELNQKITDLGKRWILFSATSMIVGALIATVMAWAVTKELKKLVDGSLRIAAGNFAQRVHINTSDELKILGDAFNLMAIKLKESHDNLEGQVKQRTAELVESKRKLEALFNGITDLISVMDPEYNIIMANHAVLERLNEPHGEVVGKKCFAKYFKGEDLCANCPVQKTIETKQPAYSEVRHFGEVLDLHTYPILNDRGNLEAIIEFGKIVTKEKMLMEQLIQSAKMASLGEMSSSIAHEIRNPLAGIKAGAQVIRTRIQSDRKAAEILSMILNETNRLEEVVTSFLSFARPSSSFPQKMDIIEVLEKVIAITEEQISKQKVKLVIGYDPEVPEVTIDGKQMQQVFLNIIINALQAMPDGGELGIQTLYTDNKIRVTVSDNGPGVSHENLENIFSPFFTTRTQGTGLGLSITKRIIEEHGGSIRAESEFGTGTRFIVELAAT
jgi:signal transduction histidine kinase